LLVQYTEGSQERERLKRAIQLSLQPLPKISNEKGNMKHIRVSTTVVNDACEERREYIYNGNKLTVSVAMHPDKESYVWAAYYESDKTWTISFGNLTISNIGEKDWTKIAGQIEKEMSKQKEGELDVA